MGSLNFTPDLAGSWAFLSENGRNAMSRHPPEPVDRCSTAASGPSVTIHAAVPTAMASLAPQPNPSHGVLATLRCPLPPVGRSGSAPHPDAVPAESEALRGSLRQIAAGLRMSSDAERAIPIAGHSTGGCGATARAAVQAIACGVRSGGSLFGEALGKEVVTEPLIGGMGLCAADYPQLSQLSPVRLGSS